MSFTSPRSRHTYTWNHFAPSLTAATSSMERVLIVDSVYGRPARAAARATASSPSGSAMRVNPVGASTSGIRERPAEQRRRGVDRADVAQDPGDEGPRRERVDVGGEGALVLGAAVDVVEHAAGEAAAGDVAQVGDAGGPPQPALDRVELDRLEAEDRPERVEDGHRVPSLAPL